jgi:hypothetical protein
MKYVAEMSEASSSTQSHTELLALEWWMVEEFRQHGEQIESTFGVTITRGRTLDSAVMTTRAEMYH